MKEEFNEKFSNENEFDNNGFNQATNNTVSTHKMIEGGNEEVHKLAVSFFFI